MEKNKQALDLRDILDLLDENGFEDASNFLQLELLEEDEGE